MIFTSTMRLLAAVVRETDSDAVAGELLRLGALEMLSPRELAADISPGLLDGKPPVIAMRLQEARKRIELFMDMSEPAISKPRLEGANPGQFEGAIDIDAVETRLNELASVINSLRDKQKNFQDEILRLDEMRRQLEAFGDLKAVAAASSSYSFLAVRAGVLPEGQAAAMDSALEGLTALSLPSDSNPEALILLSLQRDSQKIDAALERIGWQDVRLADHDSGGGKNAIDSIDQKIDKLRSSQKACLDELSSFFKNTEAELSSMWAKLRYRELTTEVYSRFSRTERTVIFTGWIPAARAKEVETALRHAAKGGVSLAWMDAGRGETKAVSVPVEMKSPKALKPFEGLVKNYAIPEYGTVNPTPFVAVAYLCMFGLMFGDAGHGLVVGLVGILGFLAAKKSGKPDGLFRIMAYCGGAAIIAGILFGSYFGMALFPPLWFDYHGIVNGHSGMGAIRTVYDILGITIRFGMMVLGLGFILNWVNLFKKRHWLDLFLDKAGIVGGWIYGAGAWAAFMYVGSNYKILPSGKLLFFLLGIPTIALGVKAPIEFIIEKKHKGKRFKPAMIMDFMMIWIVEILEVYSGYLANTLSFMRVAGLGIAHVSLMTAFFQIARMISPEGQLSPVAIAVMVLGNALVIALEGLSAGIQSLRLNYYEFFSKYFNGSGKAYRPISLGGV
ncbi:hypothetical protein MASR2M29_01070 [Spirochaetota bacterium]